MLPGDLQIALRHLKYFHASSLRPRGMAQMNLGRYPRPVAQWRVSPTMGSRLPHVEGSRALAAGSIVVYHVWLYGTESGPVALGPFGRLMPHLPLGVTLFFTLSGFLLYRPFAAALLRARPRPDLAAYLRNRALRILPAYWVILLITGVVMRATIVSFDLQRGSLAARPGLLVRDALLVQNYDPGTILTGIGPAWSLAIEAVFYLALPILVLVAFALARRAKNESRRRRLALLPPVAMLIVGVSGKLVASTVVPGSGPGLGWVNDWHSVLERSFWVQGDLFAYGMLLAVLTVHVEDGRIRLPRFWWPITAVAFLALAGVTAAAFDRGSINQYVYDSLMAAACGLFLSLVVLSGFAGGQRPAPVSWLEARPIVWVGVVSYSLFLWHEPIIWWLRDRGMLATGGNAGFLLNLVIVGAVSLALSALTYKLVELPALRRKARTPTRDERVALEAAAP
jgi:peptidoglycan/LPS O-acetylase OafA/YrhL